MLKQDRRTVEELEDLVGQLERLQILMTAAIDLKQACEARTSTAYRDVLYVIESISFYFYDRIKSLFFIEELEDPNEKGTSDARRYTTGFSS